MKTSTVKLVRALLQSDETIPPKQISRFIALLQNGGSEPKTETVDRNALPLIIRRKDVAKLLGRKSPRSVDYLVEEGLLERKTFSGRKQASGITRESLLRLLAEENTEPGKRKGAAQ